MQRGKVQKKNTNEITLYAIVYETRVVRFIATFVFVFFLINPLIPALAAEEEEDVPVEPATDIVLDAGSTSDALAAEVPEVVAEEQVETVEETSTAEVPSATEDTVEDTAVSVVEFEEAVVPNETSVFEQEEVTAIDDVSQDEVSQTESNNQDSVDESLTGEEPATDDTITEALPEETTVLAATSSVPGSTGTSSTTTAADEEVVVVATDSQESPLDAVASTSTRSSSTVTVAETTETTDTDVVENTSLESTPNTNTAVEDATNGQVLGVEVTEETSSSETQQNTPTTVHETETATTTEEHISIDEDKTASTTEDLTLANENTVATTTTNTPPPTQAVTVLQNANNTYQFSEGECRAMGDGTFYCAEASSATPVEEDAVYAEADSDGDLEIFVRLKGVVTQITHNLVDDSAPYYDAVSNTIIWHSLLNDRYQIVSYDLDTGETTVLTNTTYNNMQPMTHGDVSYWQAWIGGNWEIVRYENGEMIQMTDNNVHDIAPYALEDFVMWQTQNGDQWDVTLYDEEKDTTQIISSDTAGYTKNPRLVLMYESFDANGDMQMIGYDLRSKEYIPLSAVPTSLPQQLPEPDPIGEEKALITSQPTLRKDMESEDVFAPDGIGTSTSTPGTISTSTDTNLAHASSTIVIPAFEAPSQDAATSSTEVDTATSTSVAHIPDVVVPPIASTTSTSTEQTQAVVIPSFVGTTTPEVL